MNKSIQLIVLLFFVGINSINAHDDMLNKKEEKTVTISAFTAKGDLDNLKVQLNEGLDVGLTVNEIKKMVVQSYAYCGFPRAIRGLQTFMVVFGSTQSQLYH